MNNVHKLKQEICEIGRRIYNKGFAAANDGNISYPPRRERGALHADDDLQGLHEARRPLHRRHGGQAALRPPQAHQRGAAAPGDHEGAARREERRALPSAARHGLRRGPRADPAVRAARGRGVPGRRADHASTKRPAGRSSPTRSCRSSRRRNVIILANHGTVSFGETVEQAYWWTEILDAYCRILMLARDLGKVNYFTEDEDARAVGPEDEVGLQGRAAGAGHGELRHLRQRRLPRQLDRQRRRAPGVRRAAADAARRRREHGVSDASAQRPRPIDQEALDQDDYRSRAWRRWRGKSWNRAASQSHGEPSAT